MYRFILISFISIIFSLSINYTFSQDEAILKGDVKTVKEISYDEVDESEKFIGREINYESVTYYNRDGKIREQLGFHDADTTFNTYHYDAGRLVETHYFRRERIHDKTEFRYNSKGDLASEIYTDVLKDTVVNIKIYRYDDNNKLEKVGTTDVNGKLKSLYKYDDNGNKAERIYSWGQVKCKYDSLGREIEMNIYDDQDELTSTWIHIYEGDLLKERYEINDQGKKVNKMKYEYSQFDKQGNWLRKVIYEDDEVISLILREIKYY